MLEERWPYQYELVRDPYTLKWYRQIFNTHTGEMWLEEHEWDVVSYDESPVNPFSFIVDNGAE